MITLVILLNFFLVSASLTCKSYLLLFFFSRGHGNEFNNLIGSLCRPDFPISAHGHHNAYVSLTIDSSLSLSFFIDLRE